ncbi:hypothetical protein WAF17_03580 [Bernardetia sp. ABR2-2B]|uniref:hypothetical protein n=1 Tax=Bernardetia sp. ABR2-2B TaxID=3127472 RepID=UPI0030D33025
MKSILLIFIIFFIVCFSTFAQILDTDSTKALIAEVETLQNETPKIRVTNWKGQIAVTTDGEAFYTNFGGPGIRLGIKKSFGISINMFPSLKFKEEVGKTLISPTLGAGFQLYFKKHFVISIPIYYQVTKWQPSFGIGYGF